MKDTMVGEFQCRVHLRWDGLILVITEHKNLVQFLSFYFFLGSPPSSPYDIRRVSCDFFNKFFFGGKGC